MTATHIEDIDHVEDHPNRDALYVKVAVFLAIVTAAEVATYFLPDLFGGEGSLFFVLFLLAAMAVKFVVVAGAFMHLKFDHPVLSYAFYSGLLLALGVFLGVLTAFRVWWGG